MQRFQAPLKSLGQINCQQQLGPRCLKSSDVLSLPVRGGEKTLNADWSAAALFERPKTRSIELRLAIAWRTALASRNQTNA